MYYAILWLAATIVFALVEAITPQLVSIWFAGGAVSAFVVSLFDTPFYVQIIIFTAVSIFLIVLTRPFVKRLTKRSPEATNSDANIGKTAVVLSDIKEDSVGTVFLDGLEWSAKSTDGRFIKKGSKVTVSAIEGVKLIVEKI